MSKPRQTLSQTAAQTAGPYVHIGCTPNVCEIAGVFPQDLGASMGADGGTGPQITLRGRIFDGADALVTDALVEIWQADAAGRYPSNPIGAEAKGGPFTGFGRAAVDPDTGVFVFRTIKPGRVPGADGRLMAPHVTLWIAARGINLGLHTRMYFADEPGANAADPILTAVVPADRRPTLLATRKDPGIYHFDIHLQGSHETVFFDV